MDSQFRPGEVVYIIIRNPHAQDVAQVQQAAVVENPDNPSELALFAHETYYPLSDEFALFKSEEEAEQAYQEAFGSVDIEGFYG
ncbi:transcriptional regulator SplA domain-containing protein [Ornithinibacillus halophilus]|uniref:Transcriptional regulator n=1 Tax=Ornithinibacillus halophilus TaxID=930117 RepID=A0A1M5IJ31_9BACI|nr:transcriptional regulator SplA domain-containing protein [Ornithinibacillus halophilus]SHG28059.1 transcriptional regulator [Ornithinibacillus halophilus]